MRLFQLIYGTGEIMKLLFTCDRHKSNIRLSYHLKLAWAMVSSEISKFYSKIQQIVKITYLIDKGSTPSLALIMNSLLTIAEAALDKGSVWPMICPFAET